MYGLSKETDFSFFLRQQLERVVVHDAQAQLHFTNDVAAFIEGDCLIDNEIADYKRLVEFVDAKVFGVTIQDDGRLNILFENGRRLSLLDSNEHYESYQITGPDVMIIV